MSFPSWAPASLTGGPRNIISASPTKLVGDGNNYVAERVGYRKLEDEATGIRAEKQGFRKEEEQVQAQRLRGSLPSPKHGG